MREKFRLFHRDIKPANIIITSTGIVKLTDFGFLEYSQSDIGPHCIVGTLGYWHPIIEDAYNKRKYTDNFDVWKTELHSLEKTIESIIGRNLNDYEIKAFRESVGDISEIVFKQEEIVYNYLQDSSDLIQKELFLFETESWKKLFRIDNLYIIDKITTKNLLQLALAWVESQLSTQKYSPQEIQNLLLHKAKVLLNLDRREDAREELLKYLKVYGHNLDSLQIIVKVPPRPPLER